MYTKSLMEREDMANTEYLYRILQLKLPVSHSEDAIRAEIAKRFHLKPEQFQMTIIRQSLDARKKDRLLYNYVVDVKSGRPVSIPRREQANVKQLTGEESYRFTPSGRTPMPARPVIVGTGPCGLFCGYLLALWGYRPILLERGESVDARSRTVKRFWKDGVLDSESNVQFGEGGAGTFSDGKLNTLIKDPNYRIRFTLETFVKYGAPESILYEQKPHIGTDLLRKVVRNMREDMIRMGAEFRFSTKLESVITKDGKLTGIVTREKCGPERNLDCSVLILALGHSARDTFWMLYKSGIAMEQKSFAVGVRMEHPQDMISISQYGAAGAKILPAASYKLTAKAKDGRGVYTFCMCPGGYVVNASSEPGRLAVNGMSYRGRNGVNANSAIIVTVTPQDFPSEHPLAGIDFQRNLEERAYKAAEGRIPVQLFGDFMENQKSAALGEIVPQTMGDWSFARISDILPGDICRALKDGISQFGSMIDGFDRKDAILSAVESRTSSPVRIQRDEHYETNIKGIYPAGEGAGYAGGITSAAVDGMRMAEKLAERYGNSI